MYETDKLLDLGLQIGAKYIVMSDYPEEHSSVTIKAAEATAPKYKQAGVGTFFVPQSRICDIEDLIAAYAWASCSPLVDYIGVSILGVPNGYGVERNPLQRFMSRWKLMRELDQRGILSLVRRNGKKIHCLGMVDGPNEIALLREFGVIDTWDSSAAIWCGLNGIRFDKSPTGLEYGKFETPVDFDHDALVNGVTPMESDARDVTYNMAVIDNLCSANRFSTGV